MANVVFSPTYGNNDTFEGGFNGIKGNSIGAGMLGSASGTTTVVMGNSPAVPVFVPYGQTWPR
jgi:hypothetical protein